MPVIGLASRGTNVMREVGWTAVPATFGLVTMVAALGLGAVGATHGFAEQATHFLFTKPRSRLYFVWVGWLVGCMEVLNIAAVSALTSWATLAVYGIRPFRAPLFGSIEEWNMVEMLLFGLFVYALTYSLTAILRNGLKGLGGSMGILTAINAFGVLMRVRWNIHLPIPVQKIGSLPLAASYIVWMSIALLFVYAAQVAMQRAEI
ncbi:MAG: hypothetical protein WB795_04360 [Candidatus Acidiferrales bacterium]